MPFSFSLKSLRQINFFQSYYFIQQHKSPESNNHTSVDICRDSNSEDTNVELFANDGSIEELVNKASIPLAMHEKSIMSLSSGIGSIDGTITPTMEFIDQSTSNICSDYDMISVSSWDIDLSISGDEDAIDSDSAQIDCSKEIGTPENSPNTACCSAKTPMKSSTSSIFFKTACLKRRNAVRHECKYVHRKPSWAMYRPQNETCLHNRICPDSDCINSNPCDRGVTIGDFYESMDHNIYASMNEFRSDATYGETPVFLSYSNPSNTAKNRYSDIPCIEGSRVILVRDIPAATPLSDSSQDDPLTVPTDYIHANWVDGYRQKNAYICTQGPLLTTVSDFWHMVMQYRSPIIVMTTRPREQNRDKCYEYWPEQVGMTKLIVALTDQYDSFEVTCLRSKEFGPNCPKSGVCEHSDEHWYRVALLEVTNCRTRIKHRVNHFYFHSWPDQGIPHNSEAFLPFILQIRRTYMFNIAKLNYESEMEQLIPPPPIVVHCSAGIGRTGTYVVIDICTKSLSDCGRFNLHQTLLKVRSQRYRCVQNCHQYLYCRNTIIDYARHVGMLERLKNELHADEDMEESDDDDDNDEDVEDEEVYEEIDQDDFEEEIYEEQEHDNEDNENVHEVPYNDGEYTQPSSSVDDIT